MIAMPICGKQKQNVSCPEPVYRFSQNLLSSIGICSNDDLGLTLTFFTAVHILYSEKSENFICLDPCILNMFRHLDPIWIDISLFWLLC